MIITPPELETFELAFDNHYAACRATCACGKVYYDDYNEGYTWEDGELEALYADPKATALEHSVGFVEFDGTQYVSSCSCWHEKARKIVDWLNRHAKPVAEFLSREKKRKQTIADASPTVD